MFEKIKEFYWFHIRNRCPVCHSELVEKGYPDLFSQYYKCLKCGWGEVKDGK